MLTELEILIYMNSLPDYMDHPIFDNIDDAYSGGYCDALLWIIEQMKRNKIKIDQDQKFIDIVFWVCLLFTIIGMILFEVMIYYARL